MARLTLWACAACSFLFGTTDGQALGVRSAEKLLPVVKLLQPAHDSKISLETALRKRRSIRSYSEKPLTLTEISQILWAAQGITGRYGLRSAPSAGALYPLEVYLVAGMVTDLEPGTYKYRPQGHELIKLGNGDKRSALAVAAYRQSFIEEGAIVIVLAAVYERTARKYGERACRYVHMEVGHAAQNIYLQAAAMNLGTVVVGAFSDAQVKKVLVMEPEEHPLCIMPVGRIGR